MITNVSTTDYAKVLMDAASQDRDEFVIGDVEETVHYLIASNHNYANAADILLREVNRLERRAQGRPPF